MERHTECEAGRFELEMEPCEVIGVDEQSSGVKVGCRDLAPSPAHAMTSRIYFYPTAAVGRLDYTGEERREGKEEHTSWQVIEQCRETGPARNLRGPARARQVHPVALAHAPILAQNAPSARDSTPDDWGACPRVAAAVHPYALSHDHDSARATTRPALDDAAASPRVPHRVGVVGP